MEAHSTRYVCQHGTRGRVTGRRYTTPCVNRERCIDTEAQLPFRPHANFVQGEGEPRCFTPTTEGGCWSPWFDSDGTVEAGENPAQGGDTEKGE